MKPIYPLLRLFSALFLVGFVLSCSKDSDPALVIDQPGQIQGLGNMPGEPTGEAYSLPAGLALKQDITGSAFYETVDTIVGAGFDVRLLIVLENKTDKAIELIFPAGLIFKSKNNDRQHGLLLKKVSVHIPADTTFTFQLIAFCCNLSKPAPDEEDVMILGVVSNSSLIRDFCERLKNKRLNFVADAGSSKNFFEYSEYFDLIKPFRDMVWNLTDGGIPLSAEDIALIESLPNE
jgi:hypothetical protein